MTSNNEEEWVDMSEGEQEKQSEEEEEVDVDVDGSLNNDELKLEIDEERYEYSHGEASKNKLRFRGQVFDMDFHPNNNLFLCGLLSGEFFCYDFSLDTFGSVEPVLKYTDNKTHSESCRGIKFSLNGDQFYTISSDKSYSTIDTETGKLISKLENAFDASINALLPIQDNLIACGDDNGIVKLFDTRTNQSTIEYKEHEDYITCFTLGKNDRQLISLGGDGYLSVMDVRKEKLYARSDQMDDELLSMSLLKDGKKLIVGTQSGVLDLFDYGDWGDFNDRFVGHPESVDGMVKLDEDTVITGSSDGIIRVVSILPNQLLGVIGTHDFPIERLSITKDRGILASCSHDQSVKFWNIKDMLDEDGSTEEQEEEKDSDSEEEVANVNSEGEEENKENTEEIKHINNNKREKEDNSSDGSEEEDSTDDEGGNRKKKGIMERTKKIKSKLNNNKRGNGFFDDL